VVGVASGTDALGLTLRALGVGPGQAVVTTAYSFVATAEAVVHAGATPVFADVRGGDWLIDLEAVERALEALPRGRAGRPVLPSGEEVTALVPVHLFGAVVDPAAMARVCRRFGLWLVEDAAQALGAGAGGQRAGSLGDAGCFSFFPSKTLGGLGDGGAVWARDPAVARRLRALRQHGQPSKGEPAAEVGRNSRLDALQAAMLSVRLPRLDEHVAERRALVGRYLEKLAPAAPRLRPLGYPDLAAHGAQQMIVRSARRDALAAWLHRHGVGTAVYYPWPLHRLAPYEGCPRLTPLLCAEQASSESLALPLYPGMPPAWVDEVATLCCDFEDPQ